MFTKTTSFTFATLVCFSALVLLPSLTRVQAFCGVGTYTSASNTCEACPNNCDFCFSGTECVVCSTGYLLYFQDEQCYATNACPSKTYAAPDFYACIDCPTHCDSCTSDGCSACSSGYLLSVFWCYSSDNCPAGTYASLDTATCNSCSSHCFECTSTECLTCSSGYDLTNGACVKRDGLALGAIIAIAVGGFVAISIVAGIIYAFTYGKIFGIKLRGRGPSTTSVTKIQVSPNPISPNTVTPNPVSNA